MVRRTRAVGKTAAATKDPLLQAADVFALRNRGASWERIAISLSITPEEAKSIFQQVLANNVTENLAEYINSELAHLYELTEHLMPHVLMGSTEHVKLALQVVEARMRLLGASVTSRGATGAEMPAGGHTGTVIELVAGGAEEDYVAAMEAAHQTVQNARP